MAKGAREFSEIFFIFIFKIYLVMLGLSWASQVALVVKNLSVNAGDKSCGFDTWVRKIP